MMKRALLSAPDFMELCDHVYTAAQKRELREWLERCADEFIAAGCPSAWLEQFLWSAISSASFGQTDGAPMSVAGAQCLGQANQVSAVLRRQRRLAKGAADA